MLMNIVKFCFFILVNILGYFTVALVNHTAIKFGWSTDNLDGNQIEQIKLAWGLALPLWAVTAVLSIGFFFTRGETRAWLILAPIYVPAIYGVGVLAYFYFV